MLWTPTYLPCNFMIFFQDFSLNLRNELKYFLLPIMKKILLILSAAFMVLNVVAAPKKEYKYVDASTFTVANKAHNNGLVYQRVDTLKYPELTPQQKKYLNFSTGIGLRFSTNSPNIRAKWTQHDQATRANSPAIASNGLDLYIKDKEGKWLFAGVAYPKIGKKEATYNLVEDMDGQWKECMIFLPLFTTIDKLEIGVLKDSEIKSDGGFTRAPIVAMGSSYTHGAASSRPGMPWPAQLSRRLGLDIANFGTSGICKLEPGLAHIIADTDADMFIFDGFSNPSAKEIRERLPEFVKIIRKAHPDTPLVFLQTFYRENSNFNLKKRKFEEEKRAAASEEMKKLMANDKNLYFLDPGLYAGDDHESSADGVHPTDMGYQRAVDNIEPHIRKIMTKYNIK